MGFRGISLAALLFWALPSSALVSNMAPGELRPRNARGAIEVCWLGDYSAETKALIISIEEYLQTEISQRAGIPLEFKENCFVEADPFYPIGITFFDDPLISEGLKNELLGSPAMPGSPGHPVTYAYGSWTEKNLLDVNLTSRFEYVNIQLIAQSYKLSPQGKLNLLRTIALHEFLHSLGFAHEQKRADSACVVSGDNYIPNVDVAVTDYDPSSIMNYCATHTHDFELGPMGLSVLDISGVKKIYLSN